MLHKSYGPQNFAVFMLVDHSTAAWPPAKLRLHDELLRVHSEKKISPQQTLKNEIKKHVKFKSFQGQGSGPAAATTLDVAMEKCVATIKQIIIIGFGCQGGIIASAKLKGAFMGQE